jgi:hypothetical protein
MSNLLPESMLAEIRARAEVVPLEPPFSHGAFAIADRRKLLAHIDACSPAGASGCGHVPAGYSCVTPGCSNGPAPEPEDLRAEVERLRVERYLCVLAMRCAMGAHHDGVDAMRERLEPVVARYGIATACAARAAISDADAACIEAQYSRSEIAGSSGEPRDECRCIPMAPRPWNFCTDCGGRIPETKGEKP